ncbi:uncharacterized protein LOC141640724 [Silene latifolia]|uniref:uncharacterized protein LOC141640724 n=1 Tax=Silene latifolia TaxID=37657 RepID=UPI003D773CF2
MTNDSDSSGTKIDSSSSYYLGPQDKPGDSITPVRLTLNNFDEWAHNVCVALKSRRKYVFVNGTINEPKAPCTQDDWETIHSMLVSWLSHTISSEVRSLLPKYENAKRLWDDMHERFSVVDGSRIQQIKAGLQECREIESVPWHTICRAARRDSDRLHQFLLGLLLGPYASLRSLILAQSPLPTVARAFHMVIQEERVCGIDRRNEPGTEIASFNFHSKNKTPSKPSTLLPRTERHKLHCNQCNRSGHDRSMCFDLMDEVPEWWYELKGIKPSGRGGGSGRGRGSGRGGGHGSLSHSIEEGSNHGDA